MPRPCWKTQCVVRPATGPNVGEPSRTVGIQLTEKHESGDHPCSRFICLIGIGWIGVSRL